MDAFEKMREIKWFEENGCLLGTLLPGIYSHTNGEPCEDCNMQADCPAYVKLYASNGLKTLRNKQGVVPKRAETNEEIAKRLGVSKRQVAKMRRRGEIE